MDQVFYNGTIITMAHKCEEEEKNNKLEAVLVRDNYIFKTGRLNEIEKIATNDVEYIDLQGRCLMPAFIDSHSHFVMNGKMSIFADLMNCSSFEEIKTTMIEYIEEKQIAKGDVVIGFGYDHNFLSEQRHPDKLLLDSISKENPIILLHISVHQACVNSCLLDLVGINENTPDPEGGVIGRMPDSMEPSGYFEESAMQLILGGFEFPELCVADMLEQMQNAYLSNGITTVQDGATSLKDWKMLQTMSQTDKLKLDVVAYPVMSEAGINIMHKYGDLYQDYVGHVKLGGYKIILDGSPQGKSAWLSSPYESELTYCGYPWMKDEDVKHCIQIAVNEKKQILAHCNGDAASEQYLRAIEDSVENVKLIKDFRPVMIHCQTVRSDQLDRMKNVNMIASVFVGHVWYWGDVHLKNLGIERGNMISPANLAIQKGLHVNFHQDSPVTKPNMMHSVWCAVNRISRSGKIIGSQQKIDVYDALRGITCEAAYEYFEESSKGSIEEGKRADMVILDQSPLEVDPLDIQKIMVLKTYKDGKLVFAMDEKKG